MTSTDRAPATAADGAFGDLRHDAPTGADGVEARTRELVAAMSPAERIDTMSGDGPLVSGTLGMKARYNGTPYVAGALARLGIPGIRFTDGPRGVVMYRSTAFPVPMARGAAFDPVLEERIGDAIGVEARAQGANLFAGVCVNLLRHPAWGRAQETYGEDGFLLGEMGAALVRGTQRHVMACVKHFAANSMENSRLWVDVRVDEADLRDIYLPHFRRCIDEGAAGVMSAYNLVNGEPCGHHHRLLTEILKGEWGFDGFVMSDFTWGIRNAKAAALGGMDLEMPFRWRFRQLGRLVQRGTVPESYIDDAVTRLVRMQVRFAGRGEPDRYRLDAVAGAEHRALAREAAGRSLVLLRNERVAQHNAGEPAPLLPLDAESVRSIAVIGSLAAEPNIGDHGSSQVHPPHVVTLLDGFAAAGRRLDIDVRYRDGSDPAEAASLAASSDVAIVVAGCSHRDEGEWIIPAGGDRTSLRLCERDEALITAVAEANARTAVVLMGGSAFITDTWHDRVPALVMAWYPGMEGGHGVADVLFGDVAVGGRLPVTWPSSENRLPHFRRFTKRIRYGPLHGYRLMEAEGQVPSFPFGFGLGYEPVEWGAPTLASIDGERVVDRAGTCAGGRSCSRRVMIVVPLTNRGSRPTVEVVQVYVAEVLGTHPHPLRTLRGFASVSLEPGATIDVSVEVTVPAGVDTVEVGRSSDPAALVVVPLPGTAG